MEDKNKVLSQEEEEKVSGGDFDINNPNPILKVFCYNCGSDNLTKGMKFDSYGRKIYTYRCNNCGNKWESLPMPMKPDQI
ncbi:MAG: hypothetical protein IKG53_04235 [Solobacterium sp.]|nr:hypothetical protein [Solobacterium sp.]